MRSTAIVGTMTLISRLLGFARDILIARHFGADSATDAFFVAFRIPNFLRRLFAEGSFAQAFVPALTAHQGNAGAGPIRAFLDPMSGTLALLLLLASIAGMIVAPALIFLFAPGFHDQADAWDLSVQMLRITFPYLFFIVLTALAGATLNSRGRFAVPAFTPALLNVSMIAATLWLAPLLADPVTALAWGVLAAGMAQLLLQIPALIGAGLLPRPRVDFRDPDVRRVLKGMTPAIFGVSVTQVNLLVDTLIASFLMSGSVSWLYYSDRLVEFPLGLFGVAVGTAILPHLAGTHRRGDPAAFSAAIDWGLRWVVLIGLPATTGLAILSAPLLTALFQFDEFTADDVAMASRSLSLYALGLPAFVAVKVLTPGFSARHDLQTPVRHGLYAMVANTLLGIALGLELAPEGWGHAALALATALAAMLNAALLLRDLLKLRIYMPQPGWAGYLGRTILASSASARTEPCSPRKPSLCA
ncbi:MAG: rane protein MviN [Proteobacteria bacterium]|nr:rane protein MviN [Pseudomonadota bacterium]